MTPPAPTPDGVQALPPPAPDAVSSPGPSSWAAPLPPPTFAALVPHVADAAARREVADAFELIWPTGEVDEELLGGPLSEESLGDMPPPSGATPSEPITLWLTPVAPPRDAATPAGTGAVPDDVVSAVQRAIAALGLEQAVVDEPAPEAVVDEPAPEAVVDEPAPEAVVDEPAPVPRLPEPSRESVRTDSENPTSGRSPSDLTDARRSALKRLINGLRRR